MQLKDAGLSKYPWPFSVYQAWKGYTSRRYVSLLRKILFLSKNILWMCIKLKPSHSWKKYGFCKVTTDEKKYFILHLFNQLIQHQYSFCKSINKSLQEWSYGFKWDRGHLFSTYAKLFEKLAFLTMWYARIRMRIGRVRNVSFSENFV